MTEDEIIRNSQNQITINENLDTLSVDEIEQRITLLKNEIIRLEHEKKQKNSSISAANAIFKN